MTEETIRVSPTVLVWWRPEEDSYGVVTAGEGAEKALVVFRNAEDARAFQGQTGKHTPAQGIEPKRAGLEELAALLEDQGIAWVAVPEAWTGEGMVDLFGAGDFLDMLETSPKERGGGHGAA